MYYPLIGFKSRKAAQISAFFAFKENPIEKLKLIKLIYLSERAHVLEHGEPMIYDELFSLPHGPICSSTLRAINGECDEELWSNYIVMHDNEKDVSSLVHGTREDFDELSDSEIDILSQVWNSFGFMDALQIRAYTHDHCFEYKEVTRGRIPILYRDILMAEGENDASEIEDRIRSTRLSRSRLSA